MRVTQAGAARAGSENPLEAIDARAAKLVRAARPIAFRTAIRPELEEVFRLRYRTVVEEGWAQPEDYPDGLERDSYDGGSVHIVGVDGRRLAATSRLVLPRPDRRLPTEEAFELLLSPRTNVADLNRIVVDPRYRDAGHRILAGLIGRSWQEARAHGIEGIVASASQPVIKLCARLGIRLMPLGPPRSYWGEQRLPVCFDVRASAELL